MQQRDAFRDLMSLIEQAALVGDLPTIEKLASIANALKRTSTNQGGIPPDEVGRKQPLPVNSGTTKTVVVPRSSAHASRKARGKAARAGWLLQVAKSSVLLTHLGGRIYETSKRERVGIAYASEQANRPDKWWLGLRDEPYSVIVLLCRDGDGNLLDFVIPFQTLSAFWSVFSRHGGQVEFHVERTGSNCALRVPGGRSVPINSLLAQYKPLQ
jgi:hypothetical protein